MTNRQAALALGAALLVQSVLLSAVAAVPVPADVVLLVVIFAGLRRGPVFALWTGSAAGLLVDVLAGGIVGVGGMAKCLTGALVGICAERLELGGSLRRFVLCVVASLVHAVCFFGFHMLLDTGTPGFSLALVLGGALLNGALGSVGLDLARSAASMAPRWRTLLAERG